MWLVTTPQLSIPFISFATVVPTGQIALPANETWKRHRRLTGPSMSRRYLERMSGRIASAANDMARLWEAKIRVVGSAAFNADLDLQLATMDAIVNITMGSPLGCVETAHNALPAEVIQSNGIVHLPQFNLPPLHEALRAMMESIERASGSPFPMLSARLFTYTSPVWRKQYKLLSSFLSNAISCSREREAILGNKGEGLATDADCVLDMIIQREAREGAEAFGKGEMLDELMTYVFAGQDTTAASLAWLVKFLPQDPEIQLRLHNEVCNVFGPGTESDEFLDFNLLDDHIRVPILEAVVAETLRCAGVASLTGRELTQDEIILDRVVPKGTQLMFTTSLMSTNQPEWGPDAKKWRPSRWLTPEGAFNRSAGTSIPFGLGQRSCFGQRLAVLQVKMFVATMSRAFFFKPVPSEVDVWRDIPAISRAGKNGDGLFADFVAHTVSIHGPISQVRFTPATGKNDTAHLRYTRLYKILLGWHRLVIVNDKAEMERIILREKITDTSARLRSVFATVLPNSQISLPANEIWKKHRRLSGPSMSRRYLERMSERIVAGANDLVGLWQAKYTLVGCSAFDPVLDFHLATMDGIVNVTLGHSIGCMKHAYDALPSSVQYSSSVVHFPPVDPPLLYKSGKFIVKEVERSLQSPFPVLTTWLFTYTSLTWWKHYNFIASFFTTAIAQARERETELGEAKQGLSTNADSVLDMIVQREGREGEEAFGKENLLDELIMYILAGQDSTAVSLSWLFKYLSTNANVQRQLHDEMCAVFGPSEESNNLDFDLLDNSERVPILESVVAETMRCAGVAAIIARDRERQLRVLIPTSDIVLFSVLQDEVILGRHVPKGAQLMFTTKLMSQSETEWGPDAKAWRPNRWLNSDGAFNRLAGPSIPFGAGQRSCFGQRLAILQLKTYLAIISRAFFFKPVPPEVDDWGVVEVVTSRPRMCYVSLERWDPKNGS
ncbi:cytochrome P450, partial [Rhizoctonia solani]